MLRTKKDTKVNKLAGAITNEVIKNDFAEIHAIGAEAVNQTVKGLIIARMMLKDSDIPIIVEESFVETEINKSPTTLISFKVTKKTAEEESH